MRGAGGLLDRYVLRRFIGAYGVCLFGFVMLFLVMDFFAKLDDFLTARAVIEKSGTTLWRLIGEYYLTKLPLILITVGPFLSLFAAIATLITFGRHNEVTPMIAAGRSHHRVLAPVYAFAVLVVFALVVNEEYAMPAAMKHHAVIQGLIEGGEKGEARKVTHIRDGTSGNVYFARLWLPSQAKLLDVKALSYHDPAGRLPDGNFDAAELKYRRNAETKDIGWFPVDGTLTPIVEGRGGMLPDPIRLAPDRPIALKVTPPEIDLLINSAEPGLERLELVQLIERYPLRYELQMQLFTRTTRPISSLVLLLLGLPFVTRPGQKTIAAGLGVALGTCAVYVGVDFLFQQLGNRNFMPPMVCAWVAPSFFGAIALSRLDRLSS